MFGLVFLVIQEGKSFLIYYIIVCTQQHFGHIWKNSVTKLNMINIFNVVL